MSNFSSWTCLLTLAAAVPMAWSQVTTFAQDPHPRVEVRDAGIRIRWNALTDGGGDMVAVYSRPDSKIGEAWQLRVSFNDGGFSGVTSFDDPTLPRGVAQAYRVTRRQNPNAFYGEGFLIAGVDVPFRVDQGLVVLVTDRNNATVNKSKIDQLIDDLHDDGFAVEQLTVELSAKPPEVKNLILQAIRASTRKPRALFLLGSVPLPKSGLKMPDGHSNHYGAWPADTYYADVRDGGWTDSSTGGTGAFTNVPNDGQFDQSYVPSVSTLIPFGRVDFQKMPGFGPDAGTEMITKYLEKLHAYRSGEVVLPKTARVYDGFGYFNGEAFGRVGFRNSTAIIGAEASSGSVFTSTGSFYQDAGVLMVWAAGGGSPTSASGVATSAELRSRWSGSVFFGLFGSYFGDYSYADNLLRTALGSGLVLETTWFARPYQDLHALGAMWSFGDAFLYKGPARNVIETNEALLGDPTVRAWYPPRLGPVAATEFNGLVRLTWSQLTGVDGYHVERSRNDEPPMRLTTSPTTVTTYVDGAPPGTWTYRIVPARLETTGSGTFWNHGLGSRTTITTLGLPPFTVDSGTPDAGTTEDGPDASISSLLDAGLADAGPLDEGTLDAGSVDAGSTSAEPVDAGQPDAGAPDAGSLSETEPDAGAVDSAAPDASEPAPVPLPIDEAPSAIEDADQPPANDPQMVLGRCGCSTTTAPMALLLALLIWRRARVR